MKRAITVFEGFVIIVGSFAGLLLLNAGLNLIIPYEDIHPYLMVVLGGIIIMITGAYAFKKK